ncbi:type II toxin-antitoxin system antitoxin DNA ADP-ribosyl glycohydrolase DarG [Mycobacteroides abscessus]|uniref:type II toxin-antitoxin system antitoxin DNA ADP-ribosyl glycohydrolase DarG n=1 Tax=Mycobacteroides abscessus TaxID=36809 RepID=UPI0009A60782|nr:macro domain-containing protein [Mycobacteroides abscessus]SKG49615.1 RNase III inhibitor [Mycobacteroides abscessus subsp. massiliense]SKH53053.1 RNase III inhibitor [Mycobacteroides abscessus subsp. massiliense]SKH96334.1 RNase III inhibitor [Mycobacteroides abscessus subsp. massiliense]SKI92738.1 RNase III inhibitor [Mycobacteroides abscessus subsp. massiliense]SKJ45635.1 RNase III inhibitor [Mycobacteroides abscessus subsp. massiliense]
MIEYGTGDLLQADTQALVNTVNCVGAMGKGIALQVKRRYPGIFDAYEKACKRGEVTIGSMFVTETGELGGPQYIINFPTKKHWRAPSQLSYIEAGLTDLIEVIREHSITSIAIPPLGAGNGGLNWQHVHRMLIAAFAELEDVRVVLYAPAARGCAPAAPQRTRMTWGTALLLESTRRYRQLRCAVEPWEHDDGVTHLEIQKLMYLAGRLEPALALAFEPRRHGPYSDKVRRLLLGMEGSYTRGFGVDDAQAPDFDPITITDSGTSDLDYFLESDPSAARVATVVDAVCAAIEGFEGAYGLELLAGTHWVANHQGISDPQAAAAAVRCWTQRGGRIFTDAHVRAALNHISHTVLP